MVTRTFSGVVFNLPLNAGEFRDAVEKANAGKEKEKRRTVMALTSPQLDARRRIQIWESFHGLHLPKSADHRLLAEIAAKTALTLGQVRQEQIRRQDSIADASKSENADNRAIETPSTQVP